MVICVGKCYSTFFRRTYISALVTSPAPTLIPSFPRLKCPCTTEWNLNPTTNRIATRVRRLIVFGTPRIRFFSKLPFGRFHVAFSARVTFVDVNRWLRDDHTQNQHGQRNCTWRIGCWVLSLLSENSSYTVRRTFNYTRNLTPHTRH